MRARMALAAVALAAVAVSLLLAAGTSPAWAQEEDLKRVQGEVRGVNLLGRTIEIDGHAGLFPKRIVVGPEATVLTPEGRLGSIAAIREGDRVQATYHEVAGQNVADEVTLLYSQEELATGGRRPGPGAGPPE